MRTGPGGSDPACPGCGEMAAALASPGGGGQVVRTKLGNPREQAGVRALQGSRPVFVSMNWEVSSFRGLPDSVLGLRRSLGEGKGQCCRTQPGCPQRLGCQAPSRCCCRHCHYPCCQGTRGCSGRVSQHLRVVGSMCPPTQASHPPRAHLCFLYCRKWTPDPLVFLLARKSKAGVNTKYAKSELRALGVGAGR